MKNKTILLAVLLLIMMLTACNKQPAPQTQPQVEQQSAAVQIVLSDEAIQVDGTAIGSDTASAVYAAKDIIYYESGKDFTYGEGTEDDAHTPEEAAAHTVIHITKPGTYSLSGKLSKGQIAIDLGENAKGDPKAVVTLILNNADITCQVAPAIIFYNVYECGSTENPTKDVDTSAAGANVVIADGSENTVRGSFVARIYKPDSVVLNQQGTAVEDAKKLHKYDGAFYSKMSMNVFGEKENTGTLNIYAENEGLDTELHLTVGGGKINIYSGNDGINTNEDGVSVTTVNGGELNILVTGETGEGDGIDSNGWLVINGGSVTAAACEKSADAGIDSDMGIYINGGTVIATGNMLDRIEEGGQTYAVFSFAQNQNGKDTVSLKDKDGNKVLEHTPQNGYSILIYSNPEFKEGTYTLWNNDSQLAGQTGGQGMGGRPGGMMPPDGFTPPKDQGNDVQRPEGIQPPEDQGNDVQRPEGMQPPEEFTPPEGLDDDKQPPVGMEPPTDEGRPGRPNGGENWRPGQDSGNGAAGELSPEFVIVPGANMFGNITYLV